MRRLLLFHDKHHSARLGEQEIGAYLSSLASESKVSASTQNQALAALLFLYQEVLERKLEWLGGLVHAKRATRLPVVLNRDEAKALLGNLEGVIWIVGGFFYVSGLRLLELLRLRLKDIDPYRGDTGVS